MKLSEYIRVLQGFADNHADLEVVITQSGYYSEGEIVVQALDTYTQMISQGVAPEQARMILPQNTLTEWIWSGTMFAFARVCRLRLDPHTQQETTEVARMISAACERCWPVSRAALMKDNS